MRSNQKITLSAKEKFMKQCTPPGSLKFKKNEALMIFQTCAVQGEVFNSISVNYRKRWKVKAYRKLLKQSILLEKSPSKIVRTRTNHLFISLFAFLKLLKIFVTAYGNHFVLRSKLHIMALRVSFNCTGEFNTACT